MLGKCPTPKAATPYSLTCAGERESGACETTFRMEQASDQLTNDLPGVDTGFFD